MKQANKRYFLNMVLATVSGLALVGCASFQEENEVYSEPVVEETVVVNGSVSGQPVTSADQPVSLMQPCDYPKGKKITPNVSVSVPDDDRFVPVKEVRAKPAHDMLPPVKEINEGSVQVQAQAQSRAGAQAGASAGQVAYETTTTSVEIQKKPVAPSRIEIEVVTPGCTDKDCGKPEDKWTQIALEKLRLEQELADLQAKKERLDELQRIAEEVRKAEAEARIAEEQARLAEEARKAEEEARKAEEELRKAEEEAARKAAEEARLAEEEAKRAEEEARKTEEAKLAGAASASVTAEACPEKECDDDKDWIAPQGTTLRTLLTEWGEASGWRVVWNMDRDYSLDASAIFRGQFTSVSAALLRSFARAMPAPKGVFYKGNKVLVVSTREDENAD